MTIKNLLLIGAGGHARSCIDVIERQNEFNIIGLIGLSNQVDKLCSGYPIIGIDDDLPLIVKSCEYALITTGQIGSSAHRESLFYKASEAGFKFPTIVSPTACISKHALIGPGSIVMHGALINTGSIVGHNCIINSRALIEHDVVVGDHCHISTGAILNGSVNVKSKSFIGSGVVIKQGLTIGSDSIVGMGLSVLDDIDDNIVFTGE
jgi:sugar O-acyltransferase (sialic acid O-acetyltransferase NeuD family)